jgi:hypothetical protein
VFENRVLRRIFGPKRDEVMEQWKWGASYFVLVTRYYRQIKSRRTRLVGHVARIEREETCTGFGWESLRERGHLEDQGVDGRMGSIWTLWILIWGVWSGFALFRIGTVGGSS